MKQFLAILLAVCMLLGTCAAVAAELQLGDVVEAQTGGMENISFGDSYYGFCIDSTLKAAAKGDKFTVGTIANNVINNQSNEDVSNLIKLLFVDNFATFFWDEYNSKYENDFAQDNYDDDDYTYKIVDNNVVSFVQSVIWKLTDNRPHSSAEEDAKIEAEISRLRELAKTVTIPDWGHTQTYSFVNVFGNTIEKSVIFDFRVLFSNQTGEADAQQDFFAYKIYSNPDASGAAPTPTPTPAVTLKPTPVRTPAATQPTTTQPTTTQPTTTQPTTTQPTTTQPTTTQPTTTQPTTTQPTTTQPTTTQPTTTQPATTQPGNGGNDGGDGGAPVPQPTQAPAAQPPKTSDSAEPALWSCIAAAALMGVFSALIRKKRYE